MLRPRLIPILQIDNSRLVKTKQFGSSTYVGDPINVAKIFNDKEVDELIIIDISATRRSSIPDFNLIEDIASECFIPVTYGGGIHTMADANKLFSLGVEKICLQSAIFNDPLFVSDLVNRFGSQAVVFSLDLIRSKFGKIKLFSRKKLTENISWQDSLVRAIELGVGEILICDAGKEGTLSGIDSQLIQIATSDIGVPVIFTGGVGSSEDILKALDSGADAVGLGAYCVFQGKERSVLVTYPSFQEITEVYGELRD